MLLRAQTYLSEVLTTDKIQKEERRNKKKSVKAIINCLLFRETDNKISLIIVKSREQSSTFFREKILKNLGYSDKQKV